MTSKARDTADLSNGIDVDSSGNVGIGTSSVNAKLDVRGDILNGDGGTSSTVIGVIDAPTNYFTIGDRGNLVVQASSSFSGAQAQSGGRLFLKGGDSYNGNLGHVYIQAGKNLVNNSKAHIRFEQGGTETARFDSSGNLLVGKTSDSFAIQGSSILSDGRALFTCSGNYALYLNRKSSTGIIQGFAYNEAAVGSITVGASSTAYNTSSDYRLKTDAQPMTGASARVQALNPVNFEWIADGTRVDGFLAHEAQAVVPEAVTGTKDAMRDEEYEVTPAVFDDDGNVVTEAVMGTRSVPDYQGIDQSKLVPLLTAALQEALTEITDLKARVAALEAV